jgi:TRAP-type C4-dicarboxylate transport system substrate-binding protein
MRVKIIWLITICLILTGALMTSCNSTSEEQPPASSQAQPQTSTEGQAKPQASSQATLPQIEIKMASVNALGSPSTERMDLWAAKKLEEITHKRAKVTFYPAGSLVPPPDMYRALQEGIADFGWILGSVTPGAFPLDDLFSLPGLMPDQASSDLVLNVLYEKYPCFEQQWSQKVKHLCSTVMLRQDIHSTTPIRNINDLKGRKIGCPDEYSAKALAKLGAITSLVPQSEMYTSGERGVIDGIVLAWGAIGNWKLDEVYKYHSQVGGITCVHSAYLMNRNTYNKFTQEEREKIDLLGLYLQYAMISGGPLSAEPVLNRVPKEKGQEIIIWSQSDVDQLRETFRPLWDEWAQKMEAKGYPGKEILKEAERLIKMYGPIYG